MLGKLVSYLQKNEITPHTKLNSKQIKDLYVIPESIKILEESTGSNLSETGQRNIFLDMSPEAKEICFCNNRYHVCNLDIQTLFSSFQDCVLLGLKCIILIFKFDAIYRLHFLPRFWWKLMTQSLFLSLIRAMIIAILNMYSFKCGQKK